jgi:hypothetical protein
VRDRLFVCTALAGLSERLVDQGDLCGIVDLPADALHARGEELRPVRGAHAIVDCERVPRGMQRFYQIFISTSSSLSLVLRLRCLYRLPLHILWGVCPMTLEWYHVVDDIAGTIARTTAGSRTRMLALEFVFCRRTPLNVPVAR